MFTIKHVSPEGYETLYEATEVSFKPASGLQSFQTDPARDVLWYTLPGTKEIRSLENGSVYVTNETGATVAKYHLGQNYPDAAGQPIAGFDRSGRPLPDVGQMNDTKSKADYDKPKAVETLFKRVIEAYDIGDVMRLSQAALNAANAICALRSAELMKTPN